MKIVFENHPAHFKNYKLNMYKILIIGAGQLGSRHLQGILGSNITATIEVVDPPALWVTEVIVGAPGTVRGVTEPLVTEAEFPCELAETTENV